MPYKDPEVRRQKQRTYSKKSYEKNKKDIIQKTTARKKVHKVWFLNYKKQLKCVTCGYSHHAALDFHHVERNKTNRKVHELLKDGHAKKRILEEVDKCVVLCANCHRVHHHDENAIKTNKKLAKKQKSSNI